MSSDDQELVERIRGLSGPLLPLPTGVCPKLAKMKNIRAVLFDVYGTLFVSGAGDVGLSLDGMKTTAFEEALAAAGFEGDMDTAAEKGVKLVLEEIDKSHELRRKQGVAHPEVDIRDILKNVLCNLTKNGLIDGEINDRPIELMAIEYECRINPVWPAPGVRETLAGLSEKGFLLGIISNAQFYTPLIFRALLGADPEDLGFGGELIAWSFETLEAKPSVAIFNRVLRPLEERYDISPAEALYVGNCMLKDIRAASEAGCRTAHFAGDSRSYRLREDDARCGSIEPDLVITELRQLVDVL